MFLYEVEIGSIEYAKVIFGSELIKLSVALYSMWKQIIYLSK